MSNKDSSALIGKVFQHKSGGMTAQYSVESLVSTSAVVDTYVAAPQAMAIKLFLKVLTPALTAQPGFSTRFQETVAAMLKFASPNIIQLFDYGSNDEYFYLVLEYHKSPVLQHQLRDQGAIPAESALGALQGIAGSLDLAASHQIYHGLLSPLSIHISRSRGPMVTDWGLAQLIGGTRLPRALMDDPYLAAFVAPEVHGGQPPDTLSDQYSLAATFYTMLTGKTPHAAMTNDPAIAQFRDPLARGLAYDPGARYGSIIEFYRALTASPAQPAAPNRVEPVDTPVASVNATPTAPKPTPPPEPVKPAPAPVAASPDRTMIEPPPKPAPPPEPVRAQPAAAEHTMLEMSVEELKKAMPAPPPAPAKPPPAAAEHTMLEMSVEELKKAMPAPPPAPAKPPPAAAEHTMLEMSVEELKKAMPAPPPATPLIEQTMPEMSVEEIRRAAAAELAASQPKTEIIAENAPPKRPADPVPPPAPAAPLIEQTMPEMSIEEIRKAAYAAYDDSADTLDDDEIEGEEEIIDEEPDIPRRPSGELPPVAPPKPASKPPVPAPVEPERPSNRPPPAYPVQPVQEDELPPPIYVPPQRERPVVLDATMSEMPPAASLTPPDANANRPQPRTPGLDATMTEMPAAQYDMPSMPPPLPGKQDTPSSVPYNFNTVQGGRGGQQGGRHIEHRYKTGTIDKDALKDAAHSDGLTGMLRSVPAPPTAYRVPDSTDDNLQPPRKRNYTILWIILALLLLGGAMSIGLVVLKALNVF